MGNIYTFFILTFLTSVVVAAIKVRWWNRSNLLMQSGENGSKKKKMVVEILEHFPRYRDLQQAVSKHNLNLFEFEFINFYFFQDQIGF